MVREVNKLTATRVRKQSAPGRYGDGGGLYLLVQPSGNRSWVFRWRDRTSGKLRDKGLGPTWDVTLEQARELAKGCRDLIRAGADPIVEATRAREASKADAAKRVTFGDCAKKYIEAHRAGWRNAKHAAQWTATLDTHAKSLKHLPVGSIDTAAVLRCLEAIWSTKTETATRVRQRIESVLDWATVRGYRTGDNPARWRGHMESLLPKPGKVRKSERRVALPYSALGDFLSKLRASSGLAARAIELQILTASRPGEVASARWSEIEMSKATWTIPGVRMKSGVEHRVPLPASAVALLEKLPRKEDDDRVFPGAEDRSITTAAMLKAARGAEAGIDAHGFRSTFRDWAAERTSYAREVVEAALAHRLKDKAEAAYFRSDLFEKRSRLMRDWAAFCDAPAPKAAVTPIKRASSTNSKNPA